MTQGTNREIPFAPPMECLPVDHLSDGPGRVYELKLDDAKAWMTDVDLRKEARDVLIALAAGGPAKTLKSIPVQP